MIPDGWKREPLMNVAKIQTGIAKGKQGLKDPVKVPYLRVANVQDGYLNLSEIKTILVERTKIERFSLKTGDVLMTEGGDFDKLGRGDVWQGQIDPCLHQNHVFCVRPNIERITSYFLSSLSGSNYGKYYFLSCAKRSTNLASINSTQLKEFPVLIPPLSEQKKIAQILSTWDKAIETVEKLIANSQQKKKALMQRLLTGKKRFPEFDGEWKEVQLGELCKFMKGKGLSKGKLSNSGQYKCILYGELYTRYNEVIGKVINRTDHNEGVKSESGDVLIPASTTTSGIDLANATSLKESGVLLSGDINILRTNKSLINPDFLAYVLTHVKKHDLARRAQGITIIHLYGKDIKHIKIALPPLAEQRKIVSAIASSVQEIETWQQELEHLKQEKKVLMQQLLTGKRRVKLSKQENHHANLL